jgi:hypothetical protein
MSANAAVSAEVSRRPRRDYKTAYHVRSKAKRRRDRLSQLQPDGTRLRCINENAQGTHGAPTRGCRCDACHEIYKETR